MPPTPFLARFQDDVRDFLELHVPRSGQFQTLLAALATPPATTIRVNRLATTAIQLSSALNALRTEDEVRLGRFEPHSSFRDLVVTFVRCPGEPVPVLQGEDESWPRVLLDGRCAEAVLRGAPAFSPGILAVEPDARPGTPVRLYADLKGLVRRGAKEMPPSAEMTLVGLGRLHKTRNEIFHPGANRPTGIGAVMDVPAGNWAAQPPPGIFSRNPILEAHFTLQNLPSTVTSLCLAPQVGDSVMDLCAAPGGKTGHLAEILQGTGRVTALDKSNRKVQAIQATVKRLGLSNVDVLCRDATKLDACEFAPGTFDKVLCDPPCSGLGLRPRLSNTGINRCDLETVPILQRKLLAAATALLRPGGKLVFSTCTISPWENEDNVAWALNNLPLTLVDAPTELKSTFHSGMQRNTNLSTNMAEKLLRFHPDACPDYDTPGFFLACFRKL